MELKKIQALLADYYEGKTSRKEEDQLIEFFLQADVPEELEADRLLFESFSDAAKEELPDKDFDEKFLAAINEPVHRSNKPSAKRLFYAFSGIAAGLALLVGTYFFVAETQTEPVISTYEGYTIDEAQVAYEEARSALLLISEVMNTGSRELEPLSKISEASNKLSMINKFHRGAMELQTLSVFEETKEKITSN